MPFTKKYIFSFIFLLSLAFVTIASSLPVLADESLVNSQVGLQQIGTTAFGNEKPLDIREMVGRIINIVLGFIGVIFLGLAVYGGFLYMTASGNQEKTEKAVSVIRNAVIGLLIVLASWAITRFTMLVLGNTVNNHINYKMYSEY